MAADPATIKPATIKMDTKTEENESLNRIRIRLTLFSYQIGRIAMHRSNDGVALIQWLKTCTGS
jgi:hypothetical protein